MARAALTKGQVVDDNGRCPLSGTLPYGSLLFDLL